MILYVNGDSHAAGAEAVVPYGWAQRVKIALGHGQTVTPGQLESQLWPRTC
jgi:hypothetical protein